MNKTKTKKKEREEDGLNFDREERKKMARERGKEKVLCEVVVCYWKRGKENGHVSLFVVSMYFVWTLFIGWD